MTDFNSILKNFNETFTPLQLPTDISRSKNLEYKKEQQNFRLKKELEDNLKKLSREKEAQLDTILLVSYQTLLYKYSGQEEFAIGINDPFLRKQDGFPLLNSTRVFNGSINGELTFFELLTKTKELKLDEKNYPGIPLHTWISSLRLENYSDVLPFFQTVFGMRFLKDQDSNLATNKTLNEYTTYPEISLFIVEDKKGLLMEFEYNSNLYHRESIKRMACHFEVLLNEICQKYETPLKKLTLMSNKEIDQLLFDWNNTKVNHYGDKCIHEIFEEQVQKNPASIALEYKEDRITYQELNSKANQLARFLKKQGINNTTRVGISVNRSINTVVGILGILKAGGAYVPFDSTYPEPRIKYMLQDTNIKMMIVDKENFDTMHKYFQSVICVDNNAMIIAKESVENLQNFAESTQEAYINYTSGSTGTPKGVRVSHQSVARLVQGSTYAQLNKEERFLHYSNLSFDASTFEIWGSLLCGANLAVMSSESITSGDLARNIKKYGVTILWMTSEFFNVMVDYDIEGLKGVRQLIVGGDIVSPQHVRKAYNYLAHIQLINAYGPTENTTFSCYFPIPRKWDDSPLPIGKPIQNSTVYVLDEFNELVPVGLHGELHVGGKGVALGYLNLPVITAERFVSNPFKKGERLYKTGDIVKWLPDGNLAFIGRVDNQVKIRGFRIELDEVEAAIKELKEVNAATVICREDIPNNKQLVAYIVSKEENADSDMIQQALKKRLPSYALPSNYIFLNRLPITNNGKLDRRALPSPSTITTQKLNESVEPKTEMEEKVAKIFNQVLKHNNFSISDNFFTVGGNSLTSTQLITLINQQFEIALPIMTPFDAPTIRELAKIIQSKLEIDSEKKENESQIIPVSRSSPLLASGFQKSLWLVEQLNPSTSIYNEPFIWKINGSLNIEYLETAIDILIERHEAFRTSFNNESGDVVQVIQNTKQFKLPLVDISKTNINQREDVLNQRIKKEIYKPFDLKNGPLVRILLIKYKETEYRLLFNFHHIVFDGWSLGILTRELSKLYNDFMNEEQSSLNQIPIQAADFAQWQHTWMKTKNFEQQLSYWKGQLSGELPLLDFSGGISRTFNEDSRGYSYNFKIPKELTAGLRELSNRENTTLFMTLMAAYKALLFKYVNQEDLIVGSPVAGRTKKEIEGVIGYFVNTLVYRTDLSGDPTFTELLSRVRKVALGAFTHQDVPFELLVKELKVNRHPNYSPVFQTVFVLQNALEGELELTGLDVIGQPVNLENTKFDLTLEIIENEDHLLARFEYKKELFDQKFIEHMALHFNVLIESIIKDTEVNISNLPIITNKEREHIITNLNDTFEDYPREMSFHQLFENTVSKTPNAISLEYGTVQITYQELNVRANKLAHYLRKKGIKEEKLVCICMERSVEMIVAILGVLKAGGAYVPIDPAYPKERIDYMIKDTSASVILTQEQFLNDFQNTQAYVIPLDKDSCEFESESVENPTLTITPKNLAYVIYTSGSTGWPKGVMVEHQGIVNLAYEQIKKFNLNNDTKVLQLSSLSFDASVWEIIMAFVSGGTLCLGSKEELMPGPSLVKYIDNHKISIALFTPAALSAMDGKSLEMKTLKTIIVGGDICTKELAIEWGGNRNFYNAYGPTEATVCTTISEWNGYSTPNIGNPIANHQSYVLDSNMEPVPIGVQGELYIGGDGVARGYLNLPDLTLQKFLANPFCTKSNSRIYKTGDLVKWNVDGRLEYIGRSDNQVKIRGFRIELGEVESFIKQLKNVRDTVVVAKEEKSGDKRLVAYLITEKNIEISEIKKNLKKKMPNYMVPSSIEFLESLPITPNGKVDRNALSKLPISEQSNSISYVAPRNINEKNMVAIWEELLDLKKIGIEENFFDLGGHSLLATQLVYRIEKIFEKSIQVRSVFEAPTVAELTELIQSLSISTAYKIPVVNKKKNTPLTHSQEAIWVADLISSEKSLYSVPLVWHIKGTLDVQALEWAINQLVKRHDALRTSFPIGSEGSALQLIEPFKNQKIALVESIDEKEALKLVRKEINFPFNLMDGPLWRTKLIRLKEEQYIFVFVMHHIISDGWSVGILLSELKHLYTSYIRGDQNSLETLYISYSDYAIWQRERIRSGFFEDQFKYWMKKLSGELPLLNLPTDCPRPPLRTYKGEIYRFQINKEILDRTKLLSQQTGTTLFMVLLAAYKVLLMKYTKQNDILVGTPSAGRRNMDIEGIVGCFINMLVYRTDVSENRSFLSVLHSVKKDAIEADENQDIPFEMIIEALKTKRDFSFPPIFQTMFVFQNGLGQELKLPGLQIETEKVHLNVAKYDLTLEMQESNYGIDAFFEYNTELFRKESIEELSLLLEEILQIVVESPHKEIGEVLINLK